MRYLRELRTLLGYLIWSLFAGILIEVFNRWFALLPHGYFGVSSAETENSLHQNWMRDYDPTLGLYLQADQLGLVDGASIYGYALQNPGRYTDPTGEFIPQLIGAALGVGLEYFTNKCATWKDLAIAGALGTVGGGISKAAFLRFGSRSLTRVTGKEWGHSLSKSWVNRNTTGALNRALNRRGGLNGSWTNPTRHFRHDGSRYPRGWRDLGERFGPTRGFLDRIPDWLKGTGAGAAVAAGIVGTDCECEQ